MGEKGEKGEKGDKASIFSCATCVYEFLTSTAQHLSNMRKMSQMLSQMCNICC